MKGVVQQWKIAKETCLLSHTCSALSNLATHKRNRETLFHSLGTLIIKFYWKNFCCRFLKMGFNTHDMDNFFKGGLEGWSFRVSQWRNGPCSIRFRAASAAANAQYHPHPTCGDDGKRCAKNTRKRSKRSQMISKSLLLMWVSMWDSSSSLPLELW